MSAATEICDAISLAVPERSQSWHSRRVGAFEAVSVAFMTMLLLCTLLSAYTLLDLGQRRLPGLSYITVSLDFTLPESRASQLSQ
jgi:hypothetical protein